MFACGRRPPGLARGYFIEPTVIRGLTNAARVAREEIFGPVLVVLAHDGDDDAVRIANDSPYGLSATVWGADLDRVDRVVARAANRNGQRQRRGLVQRGRAVRRLQAVGVGREMGLAGFEEYLETKLVATAVNA